MKFKVGDLVRVRDDLVVGRKYGSDKFIYDMEQYKGKITTIIKVFSDGTYLIKYCDWWNWADEMLEKANIDDYIKQFLDENKEVFKNYDINFSVTPKPQILDEVEKRYLSNIIRPFRGRVIGIVKIGSHIQEYQYISIRIRSLVPRLSYENINLPYFHSGIMYKGMKVDKYYTLEELGL